MGSLERLTRSLEPLKLYALRKNSLVDRELAAYGAGFSVLEELLEEIRRGAFVQTAEGEELLLWEKLVGLQERPNVSPATRRELVLYRLAVAPFDFDLAGMHSSLRAAGMDAEILEHAPEERLTVRSERLIDEFLDMDMVKVRLEAMLPAHLDYELDIGFLTWNMFDEADPDWDEWDGLDFTWTYFDIDGHNLFVRKGGTGDA